MTFIEARPEKWDYAKPFEDIPGSKPLPIIGNAWRFIPYIGNIFCCFLTLLSESQSNDHK